MPNPTSISVIHRGLRIASVLLACVFLFAPLVSAQVIAGHVTDEKREPIVGASVQVLQKSILKGNTNTDIDGNYILTLRDTGYYDVLATYRGYDSLLITGVLVTHDTTIQNFDLSRNTGYREPIIFRSKCLPILDIDNPTKRTFYKYQIDQAPH